MRLDLVFQTPSDGHYFSGYFDRKVLFDQSLVVHKVSRISEMNDGQSVCEIGLFDIETEAYKAIDETYTWNFQQGANAQYLDSFGRRGLIYNTDDSKKYRSKFFCIETGKVQLFNRPFYDFNAKSQLCVSIDFERHDQFRDGYNYKRLLKATEFELAPASDGYWIWDFSESHETFVSLKNIMEVSPVDSMKGALNYVEHFVFNPCGDEILFLHRWKTADGAIFSRLMLHRTSNDSVVCLIDSGKVSHFCWLSNHEVLFFGANRNALLDLRRSRSSIGSITKPLRHVYKMFKSLAGEKLRARVIGERYLRVCTRSGVVSQFPAVPLVGDGHPAMSPVSGDLALDCYPNFDGVYSLMIMKDGQDYAKCDFWLDKYYRNTGFRCDLHPKWSLNSRLVSVDVIENDVRKVKIFRVSDEEN